MSSFTEILGKFKRRPSDVIALDIGATGIKAVRIKKSGDGLTLVSADILPAIDLVDQPDALSVDEQQPIDLKPALKARQVAVTYSSPNAIIKLLSFPGEFDEDAEEQVGKHLGLDEETEENYRISYKIISESRQESKVLAVAFPEVLAQTINDFFPIGLPAPYTIEVAGLSSMTSFLNGPGVQHAEDTVGVLDFGASQSFYSLFHQGQLALIRKFDFGVNSIVDKVTKSLGVDKQTAEGILADGSFDISQPMAEVMGPFIKQLIISRDFVERRENTSIKNIYMCGAAKESSAWTKQLSTAMAIEMVPWNPFDGATIAPDALPAEFADQTYRFAAAVGAAQGAFEEE